MEDNNFNKNEPSTNADVNPRGGLVQTAKNKARNFASNLKDAASRGIKALWTFLPTQVKIVVIVIIIVIIVIISLLAIGLIKEGTSAVKSGVDNFFNENDLDNDTKNLYENNKSLLMVKLSDIDKMYNSFIETGNGGAETQTAMKYEIGSKNLSNEEKTKRVVDIDDKLPAYKHILMTEKYNFNKIKYKKYSHANTSGADLAERDYQEDKEVGLKFPKDSKNTKLLKFVNMTTPYLQTWYIPLSMNTASIVSGTETDSNRNPLFSYNIIKEAYSNIVVNWYELKKCKLITYYETYEEVYRHDRLQIIADEFPMPQFESDSSGRTIVKRDSNGNILYSGTYETQIISKSKLDTVDEGTQQCNTATLDGLAGGTRTPGNETFVSKNEEVTPTYYISKAETFDIKIINEFNYETYVDSDVDARRNEDTKSEEPEAFRRESLASENKASNVLGSIGGTYRSSIESALSSLPQDGISVASAPTQTITTTINGVSIPGVRKTIIVDLEGYIDYENCIKHTVTRIWNDKLRQTKSENEKYTMDDLIAYNESDDRKEKVSSSAFCGTNSSNNSSSGGYASGTPTTSFQLNGYTFPVYNQNVGFGSDIAESGCGLCAITVVIDAYKNKNYDPRTLGNEIHWSGAVLTKDYADILNDYGFSTSVTTWGNGGTRNENISLDRKKQITREAIDRHLRQKKPVIVQVKGNAGHILGSGTDSGHYIVLAGYQGNKIIIANSAGGLKNEVDMDTLLSAMYDDAESDHGFMLIDPDGGSFSGGSSSNRTNNGSGGNSNNSSASSELSSKLQDMINYAVSFPERGKTLPYGAPPYIPDTKDKLENISQIDCSGFVTALYQIFFDVNIAKDGIRDIVSNASGINEKGLKGETHSYDRSRGSSQLQVGDILHNPGHVTMYIGEYNGVPSLISQGQTGDPSIRPVDTGFYSTRIDSYSRYIGGVSINGANGSSSFGDSTCNGKAASYYRDLIREGTLNRIDFMNSNPDIYNRYLRKDAPYMTYVGYSRSKLNLSYWNLKELFREVDDEKGYLPWVYGGSLGFENTYLNRRNGVNGVGGEGVQAMVESAKQLAAQNNGEGLWHYCQGDAAGASHANRRFIFHNIEEMQNYINIGESAGTDCSAFVLSMYLAYTGVSIDPGGNGSSLRSYAESNNGSSLPDSPNVVIQYHTSIDAGIQAGDVLYGPGHVGLYVGDDSQVDQGGGGVGGLCNIGMGWTGPKFDSLSNRGYTGYIHYEGLPSVVSSGGTGTASGEFLIKSGYEVDSSYRGQTYPLTSQQRDFLERLVCGEFGTSYEGSVLIAQCLRDAFVNGLCDDPMKVKLLSAQGGLGYTGSIANKNENSINAVKYVFDEGGSGLQHRIYYMCTIGATEWHYTQHKIYRHQNVDFFDGWN